MSVIGFGISYACEHHRMFGVRAQWCGVPGWVGAVGRGRCFAVLHSLLQHILQHSGSVLGENKFVSCPFEHGLPVGSSSAIAASGTKWILDAVPLPESLQRKATSSLANTEATSVGPPIEYCARVGRSAPTRMETPVRNASKADSSERSSPK